MVNLVDLGEYQVFGLVGLVDREGPDLLSYPQALQELLPLLVPMEGQSLRDFVLEGFFLRRFLCLCLACNFHSNSIRCWHRQSFICHMLLCDSALFPVILY